MNLDLDALGRAPSRGGETTAPLLFRTEEAADLPREGISPLYRPKSPPTKSNTSNAMAVRRGLGFGMCCVNTSARRSFTSAAMAADEKAACSSL